MRTFYKSINQSLRKAQTACELLTTDDGFQLNPKTVINDCENIAMDTVAIVLRKPLYVDVERP